MLEIYGRDDCYWCNESKKIALQYKIPVTYCNINVPEHRAKMFEMNPDAKTVPQIWKDGRYIGGYMELVKEIENTMGGYGDGKL